jgi:hypothetical protein
MYKTRSFFTIPNLVILGTTVCLFGVSQLADALAQSARSSDIYGGTPIYQSSTVQSLGTLHTNDTDTDRPVYNQANTLSSPLQPVQAGAITYVTGGIGDEERNYLHSVAGNYNLHVSNASHDGAFIGDTHIVLHNRKGDVLLDANAGPLFLAQLPPGSYVVEVTHDGQVKTKTIRIGRKAMTTHFSW